jgi:hypothetical protein
MQTLNLSVLFKGEITPMQLEVDALPHLQTIHEIKAFLTTLLKDDITSREQIFFDCEKHNLHFEPLLEINSDNVYQLCGVSQNSIMLKRIPIDEITIVLDTHFEKNFKITNPVEVKDLYKND